MRARARARVCVCMCVCVWGVGVGDGAVFVGVSCVCVCASVCVSICHLRDRKEIFLVSKDKNKVLTLESYLSISFFSYLPSVVHCFHCPSDSLAHSLAFFSHNHL